MSIIENVNKELLSAGEYMAMLMQMSGKPVDFPFKIGEQQFVMMIREIGKEEPVAPIEEPSEE